ncbi:MAG: GNAT family N-acetyltransferase [Deltaproteobacteria bacterium]|nr:GNAT family N-acetyltransferase [Deltaproteobacteria bacterium]
MGFVVRGLEPGDVDRVLAIQHATCGEAPRWSRDLLVSELTDPGRDHGRRVRIVTRGGEVVAGAGFVPAGPDLFIAPMFTDDEEAGVALVKELVELASAAERVRVSVWPSELTKRRAVERLGFRPAFAFLTLARGSERREPVVVPYRRSPVDAVPTEVMRDAHNEAFRGVSNAPPQSVDEVRSVVGKLFAPGSGVWLDEAGTIAGYVWALRDADSHGDHVVIDAVGVAGDRRGAGLGSALVRHVLDAAARAGIPEVRALIASDNAASLALHRRSGFVERWRRDVFELGRTRPGG